MMVHMAHPIFHRATPRATPPPPASADDASPWAAAAACSGHACKMGSLQEYVPHECDTSEMGASRFPVRDVQRIAILDLRLFNTDRHAGNMLVRRARPTHHTSAARLDLTAAAALELRQHHTYELIPIDHGFALPENLEPPYFEWQHWPQVGGGGRVGEEKMG